MKNIYVFDLDGTLIDSVAYYSRGILKVLEDEGISYPPDIMKMLTPMGYAKCAEYFITLGVRGTSDEILNRIYGNLINEYAHNIKLKPGVMEYLEKLHTKGNSLYVLSASPHILIDVCIENNGIRPFLSHVWSTDDYIYNKTDPEIFHKLAENIGCLIEDIKYFDDSVIALKVAGSVGLDTVGVYDPNLGATKREIADIANSFICSFEELI